MKPFELTPGWRIGQLDRQFTLEYLQQPKKAGAKPSWRTMGYFGRINHVVEAWMSEALRESDKTLPEALADVRRQLEEIMGQIQLLES